ncbi:MAG: hypothetical protein WD158_00380 [Balneolaceae bacterium]
MKLKVRKPKDVGGEISFRDNGEWAEVCKDVDFIFYMLDAYEYDTNVKMKDRFKDDIDWISSNNQLYAPNFGIILFVNKMDKISSDKNKREEWADRNLPEIETHIKESLDAFNQHFLLAAPIALVSKDSRPNAISAALLKAVEK